jgi:SAM-dependent methyltransferase
MLIKVPSDGYATLPRDCCPVCRNQVFRKAFVKYGDCYYKCSGCQSLFLGKTPSREMIEKAYAPVGDNSLTPNFLKRSHDAALRTWAPFFEVAEKHKNSPGRKHLDVGCGAGECLMISKEMGWEPTGLDAGESAVEFARNSLGIEVHLGLLEETTEFTERFDLVTLNAVLEHVIDPVSFFAKAASCLKPGGVIWLTTPTTDFLGHILFRQHWYSIHSAHLQYFSRRGVSSLLSNAGIQIVDAKTFGGGMDGVSLAKNILRTNTMWTIYSVLTRCRLQGWATEGPNYWFSPPGGELDPRLKMRKRMDRWFEGMDWFLSRSSYPLRKVAAMLDREQAIAVFGQKPGTTKDFPQK